jgi:hypothetical protein
MLTGERTLALNNVSKFCLLITFFSADLTLNVVFELQTKDCHTEPIAISAPWRMDSGWTVNNYLLGSSSVGNHSGRLVSVFITYQLTTN